MSLIPEHSIDMQSQNTPMNPSNNYVVDTGLVNRRNRRKHFSIASLKSSLTFDPLTLADLVQKEDDEHLEELGGVEGVAYLLQTNLVEGINGDDEDIACRNELSGSNIINDGQPLLRSFLYFLVGTFKDLATLILLLCAMLSLGLGIKQHGFKEGWYASLSILFAVFFVTTSSAIIKCLQRRASLRVKQMICKNTGIEVIRGSQRKQISWFRLVNGDIVCLNADDYIPVDGLLVNYEIASLNKSRKPFLVSGTTMVGGSALMLVTSVQPLHDRWCQIQSLIDDHTVPMEIQLKKLWESIRFLNDKVLLTFIVVGLFTTDNNGSTEFIGNNNVVKKVAAAASIIVSGIVLESLPVAVNLVYTYSVGRMMVDKPIVLKHSACETVASVTTICTDITSSMDFRRWEVCESWIGLKKVHSASNYSNLSGVVDLIREGIALNPSLDNNWGRAILNWAIEELKLNIKEEKKKFTILYEDRYSKCPGALVRDDNGVRLYFSGLAEDILPLCRLYCNNSGLARTIIGSKEWEKFRELITGMKETTRIGLGLPVYIAFAYRVVRRKWTEIDLSPGLALREEPLTLLGLVGINFTRRPRVEKAVQVCQRVGVDIKFFTPIPPCSAEAIVHEYEILLPGQDIASGAIVEGMEFQSCTPQERMDRIDKISVLAGASLEDKILMLQCLKQKGRVIAWVTSNNDLELEAGKEVDVQISMGSSSTSTEMSDLTILDNSFTTLATILEYARHVPTNIQKIVQFQLTTCIAPLVVNFVATIYGRENLLTATQLSLVNLITGTLGILALALEIPTNDLMEKLPIKPTDQLITNVMLRNLLAQASYQIVVLLILTFRGEPILGLTEKVSNTFIFNTLVLCQVFNLFNVRSLEKKNVFKGIHKNKTFLSIIGIIILLHVLIVQLMNTFPDNKRLNLRQWSTCIGIASISWPIDWIVKCKKVYINP